MDGTITIAFLCTMVAVATTGRCGTGSRLLKLGARG
jgi:hypothetical protein